MDKYTKLCKSLIQDHIKEEKAWDKSKKTTREILQDMLDNGNENIFGNIDGSRTCNTYEAQKFLETSGALFDEDIRDMFSDIDEHYFAETLERGAEVLDVVILELLSNQVINEMLEGQNE